VGVLTHRLAVRNEHHFDRKLEQRAESSSQLVKRQAGHEIAKPGLGTKAKPARIVPEEPVAGNENARPGKPDHRLARPPDPDRLCAFRQAGLPSHVSGAEAFQHVVAASPVPADRREDDNRLPVPGDEVFEWGPEVTRDERIDEEERIRGLVRNTSDLLGPVSRAFGLRSCAPVRMPGSPAPKARTKLLERCYRVSSGGFWTLCSVAYSSTSLLITSAPSP
jgi:hypothetical protein